LKREN